MVKLKPWIAHPSRITNDINSVERTYVDEQESIGSPADAPATDVSAENSFFSLLKGIATNLGLAPGSGGDVNDNGKIYADPLVTLGQMSDPRATDTGSWSAISLLKGIAHNMGLT